MCGIFGAVGGSISIAALDRVGEALKHRGPDAEGRFISDDVTLLHRRLRVIDLSEAADQPMHNADSSVTVVFNGEIYNHHALRNELTRYGHHFQSRSDTEVILRGYEQWGENVVSRLDGMFAFGVWDRKLRVLLLARDRAGKKPLFYSFADGVFRFSSNIAGIHASGLEQRLSNPAIPMYLAFGFVPSPDTLYEGVSQLAPASILKFQPGLGSSKIHSYWQPCFGTHITQDSFEHASGRIRQLVEDAVKRRLEADVPLGAFLSGGVDSSIIVGLMSRLTGSRIKTFSIGFSGDSRYDETRFARLVARAFGTDHIEFTLGPSSFDLIDSLIRHHDGPFGDSSAIPTSVVARLTRQHVTVALTGDGGDELFCGYIRFLAAEWAERVPEVLRYIASQSVRVLPAAAGDRSLASKVRRFLQACAMPLPDRVARWNSFFDPKLILRADVAASLGAAVGAPSAWQRHIFSVGTGRSVLARVLEHNFRTYLPWDLLVKADRTSMAHSLETRSPFLDTALIEYAATLPPDYLRRGRDTKRILKHAFRDLLPPEILVRGKMGFGVPLGSWFRGDLKDYLRDYLGPTARVFDYIDRRAVEGLLMEHFECRADHGQRLWLLLTLEIWLRSLPQSRLSCAA